MTECKCLRSAGSIHGVCAKCHGVLRGRYNPNPQERQTGVRNEDAFRDAMAKAAVKTESPVELSAVMKLDTRRQRAKFARGVGKLRQLVG